MPPACRTRSATRVNARAIIHIVVDDLGYDHVGYQNSRFITPNIDALRGCGVHLDSFYSFRTCAPARASILAEWYPFSMGIYENADIEFPRSEPRTTLLFNTSARTRVPLPREYNHQRVHTLILRSVETAVS